MKCGDTAKEFYRLLVHIKCNLFLAEKYIYFEQQQKRHLTVLSIRKATLERVVIGCCLPTPWADREKSDCILVKQV